MKFSYRHLLVLIFISLSLVSVISAQGEKKKKNIGILDFTLPTNKDVRDSKSVNVLGVSIATQDETDIAKLRMRMESMQSIVTECYTKDNRFTVVDRRATEALSKERELQKSEVFMDGYVVEQGKSIGADYLLRGLYEANTSSLTLTLYSMEDGKVASKEREVLKSGFLGNKDIVEPIQEMVRRLNNTAFPLLIKVVEAKEQSKTKVKTCLIAAGTNRGLREDMELDVKIREELEVDGEMQVYYKTVATAEVEKVEDLNFSIISIKENGDVLKQLLDSKTKVFCTFQIK
ncbi:MAG: hypothetical protein IT269_06585 [Saprospiraceae bacterium]|nr:hypothetical protein [Saprospiraceae bacterium]